MKNYLASYSGEYVAINMDKGGEFITLSYSDERRFNAEDGESAKK